MEVKDKINISIPKRLKRRLKALSEDKDVSMNDLVNEAISDYLDRMDANYSAPDLVLDRLNQLFVSQMNLIEQLDQINVNMEELNDRI